MSGNRRGFRSYVYLVLTTSRPLYWPQFGQTECGRFGCLQFGHGWIWTRASARCERRRPFLDLESLTFGRATAAEFYRKLLRGCFAALFRLRLARLQSLDAPADGGQRAPQVSLELLELLERIGFGLADDLVR